MPGNVSQGNNPEERKSNKESSSYIIHSILKVRNNNEVSSHWGWLMIAQDPFPPDAESGQRC
jgi:hypothetical protein